MGVRDGSNKDPTSHSARKRSMRRAKWRRASSAAATASYARRANLECESGGAVA